MWWIIKLYDLLGLILIGLSYLQQFYDMNISLVEKLAKKYLGIKFYKDAVELIEEKGDGEFITRTSNKDIFSDESLILDKYYHLEIYDISKTPSYTNRSVKILSTNNVVKLLVDKLSYKIESYVDNLDISIYWIRKLNLYKCEYKFSIINNDYLIPNYNNDLNYCKLLTINDILDLIKLKNYEYTKESKSRNLQHN